MLLLNTKRYRPHVDLKCLKFSWSLVHGLEFYYDKKILFPNNIYNIILILICKDKISLQFTINIRKVHMGPIQYMY